MTAEEWKPIAGFPDYLVSDLGHVLSTRRGEARELRGGYTGRGYRKVNLVAPDGTTQARKVHHLVAEAFLGPRPLGMQVRHLDDVKANNSAANLAYGTKSDNGHDSVRNGLHANAAKTSCKWGHDYTPDNTYVNPSGRRNCRACLRGRAVARAS